MTQIILRKIDVKNVDGFYRIVQNDADGEIMFPVKFERKRITVTIARIFKKCNADIRVLTHKAEL